MRVRLIRIVWRRLFNAMAVASAVLCLASAVLWVRSYSSQDDMLWAAGGASWSAAAFHGRIIIDVGYVSYPIPRNTYLGREWAGFGWYSVKNGNRILAAEAILPFWAILLATALLPLAVISTRKRPRVGYCSACGYDLRATPNRCPECGKL